MPMLLGELCYECFIFAREEVFTSAILKTAKDVDTGAFKQLPAATFLT